MKPPARQNRPARITRAALRKGPMKVRITASYIAPDGRTSRTTRVVTLKRLAPLPVTG